MRLRPAVLCVALLIGGCAAPEKAAGPLGASPQTAAVPAPQTDPLVQAYSSLAAGDFAAAIHQATPVLGAPDAERRARAHRIVGLAQFRMEQYGAAADAPEVAARHGGGSDDWFNVASAATLSGDVERGRRAFAQAVARDEWERLNPASARFYFASALRDVGAYEDALSPLTELRSVYADYKITDDTFLYIRGVPFLSDAVELAADVFRGLGRTEEGRAWMGELKAAIDPDGQVIVERYREALLGP